MLTRRRLLMLALAVPFIGAASAQDKVPQNLAVLDWGLTELILALGVIPQSVSAPDWYRKLIGIPELPEGVIDIGLLFQPNLETLLALKPGLIIITPEHLLLKPQLDSLAPTLTLATDGLGAYQQSLARLAEVLQRQGQARGVMSALNLATGQTRQALADYRRPIFIASPVDLLHLKVYGPGSIPGDVLALCGLNNAWQGGVNPQGEALVELTRIGAEDAGLILLAENDTQRRLIQHWQHSPLWQRLPLTSQHDMTFTEQNFNANGALVTATRFARMLHQTLARWVDV